MALDIGLETVNHVLESFQIDDEWCEWSDRGVTWWAHEYAQRIWAEPGVQEEELTLYEVIAETDLLIDRPDDSSLDAKLDAFMRFASLSGMVRDPRRGLITLRSSVFLHSDIQWLKQVFSLAAAVQVANAHIQGEQLGRLLSLDPAKTAHPSSGARSDPDDMLSAIEGMPQRDDPSAWESSPELDQTASFLQTAGIHADASEGMLLATFPGEDGGPFHTLIADPGAPHPQLGGGLMLLLRTDDSWSSPAPVLPMEMNHRETTSRIGSNFLGSWCSDPNTGTPAFTGFVPNVLFRPGLLFNSALSMGVRAKWASQLLSDGGRE